MKFLIYISSFCLASGYFFDGLEFGNQDKSNPDFLKDLPKHGRREFFDILNNSRLSQYEKNKLLVDWANYNNVTSDFNTWSSEIQDQKESVMKNVNAVMANLTEVHEQLEAILTNFTLSRQEQHEKIDKLATTFPREIRALFFIARHYRPENNAPIFGSEKEDFSEQFGFEQIPFPRFMMRMPVEAKKQFVEIFDNPEFSQYELNKALSQWAEENNVNRELAMWIEQAQDHKDAVLKNVNAVMSNISTVYNQLESVLVNTTLTRRSQHSQMDRLAETFPREVRALFFIARHYRPEDETPVYGTMDAGKKLIVFGFPFFKSQELGGQEGSNEFHEDFDHINFLKQIHMPNFYRNFYERRMFPVPAMRMDYFMHF
ncbi:hypothetical protein CAEBREN_04580 [Caenorhabditis brenneri]|uniref:SXP/RAL-2 family protein Ani s 5-like cation-binding domain-containing protein n=1 Tax=Caenorhabditis brenneri TaxID=135651 RepID=G0MUF5_CAEBE|nr:hypothetical protein CAEBREN_04580 [Caenorhabditis brenneri]